MCGLHTRHRAPKPLGAVSPGGFNAVYSPRRRATPPCPAWPGLAARSRALPRSRRRPQGAGRARRRSPGRRRRREAEAVPAGRGGSMRCQVTVLYFARSAELAGLRSESVSVPQRLTSLQLWEEIVKIRPRLAVIRDQVIFAVQQEYVLLGDQPLVLQTGDEVAIIPPISGG
uniref:Molybdopterin synthase sulfur carrier subunit n=1 Tax=Cairina moschata TaxID=8855 RepID=A0A8C3C1X9_CAIMO